MKKITLYTVILACVSVFIGALLKLEYPTLEQVSNVFGVIGIISTFLAIGLLIYTFLIRSEPSKQNKKVE